MNLTLTFLVLLLFALGLFCAWLLWFLRREVARLDARLDESLDDQDLIEFQERLEGLLKEARETGDHLTGLAQKRKQELEQALVDVKGAEEKLTSRAKLLGKAAEAATQRSQILERLPQAMAMAKALPRPEAKSKAGPKKALKQKKKEADPEPPRATALPAALAPSGAKRYQAVHGLADQGLKREEIARQTGLLAGEVDLILNLRQPKTPPKA